MQKKILVIEDEAAILGMITFALEKEDFLVVGVENGPDAIQAVAQSIPDLMLVDWMLPGISGLELVRGFRRSAATRIVPIIMLTARSEENDRVDGLDSGADDYITKPFSTRELLSRISALLRRAEAFEDSAQPLLAGEIKLDPIAHELTIAGKPVKPGPTEYRLLFFLMQHPNRVYSRGQLLDYVWGENIYIEERTVDVHILRLRKLLKRFAVDHMLQTVRGIGYRFSITAGQ
ncbi:phosphate regulon transcriptional regulatory protein PhoB [bacterium BMS3Bbin11]|nr:phosphate regulon transcriptional regulatory protein PhoB [bacterium BMS3Bbin11]HDH16609.1 phosphate regulon transcriptional regulatory protein PhoB [Gammaproteobacteria bacterium]HDZ77731.1 phosphate regulon transcriptional regulatory protein PhoB [Gammaproteobacteria bacterium]